jgi:hypothetical protein
MSGWDDVDAVPQKPRKAGGAKAAAGGTDEAARLEEVSGGPFTSSIEALEKFERDIASLQKKLSNFGTKKDTVKFREGARAPSDPVFVKRVP